VDRSPKEKKNIQNKINSRCENPKDGFQLALDALSVNAVAAK